MKNILIIDTATKISSVSLYHKEILSIKTFSEKNQTKEMICLIKALLSEKKLSLSQIDAIAVCIGPGGFTGTRVGVMTAKGLSFGLEIPLFPFSTFDLFAKQGPFSIVDAKCRQIHLQQEQNIKTIPIEQLAAIQSPIYYIEDSLANIDHDKLVKTEKNYTQIISKIQTSKGLSYNELEIYYAPPTTVAGK